MIGIIVPVHDEQDCIGACAESLLIAAAHPLLRGELVRILFVLDDCTDDSKRLAADLGIETLEIAAKNVGTARRTGAEFLIEAGARWLSFTDADSIVAPDWLVCQLEVRADVVCGTIEVNDWLHYGERMKRHFELTYTDADGHSHVHGANLGVSTDAYKKAGGFDNLPTGEDVALINALVGIGASICWSAKPRVVTSARVSYRAPRGFGATLETIERERTWVTWSSSERLDPRSA